MRMHMHMHPPPQTPEICQWVASQYPDKDITVGGYAYLDSAAHVQVRGEVCIRMHAA